MRWALAAASGAAPAAVPAAAPAQPPDAPFSTIAVRAAGSVGRNGRALDAYWRAPTGAALEVETPFHAGRISAAVHVSRFRARGAEQPDFTIVAPMLAWGVERRVAGPVRAYAGARVGSAYMRFAGETNDAFRSESELLAGAAAALRVRVRGAELALSAAVDRVDTSTPMRVTWGAVSLGWVARAPRWLPSVVE